MAECSKSKDRFDLLVGKGQQKRMCDCVSCQTNMSDGVMSTDHPPLSSGSFSRLDYYEILSDFLGRDYCS